MSDAFEDNSCSDAPALWLIVREKFQTQKAKIKTIINKVMVHIIICFTGSGFS